MTTAITIPALLENRDTDPDTLRRRVSDYYITDCYIADYEPFRWDQEPTDSSELIEFQPPRMVTRRYLVRERAETIGRSVSIREYDEGSRTLLMIDFEEPENEFPKDHLEAIRFLRNNGRPVLANRLVAMLRDAEEDPDEAEIGIVSLRDMARLMVERQGFADPSIGSDDLGDVYAQWRTAGNGVLVINFLGYGAVLITAQADETAEREKLDISERGETRDILRKHGRLVPSRN